MQKPSDKLPAGHQSDIDEVYRAPPPSLDERLYLWRDSPPSCRQRLTAAAFRKELEGANNPYQVLRAVIDPTVSRYSSEDGAPHGAPKVFRALRPCTACGRIDK